MGKANAKQFNKNNMSELGMCCFQNSSEPFLNSGLGDLHMVTLSQQRHCLRCRVMLQQFLAIVYHLLFIKMISTSIQRYEI